MAGLLDERGRWSAVNKSILKNLNDMPLTERLRARFGMRCSVLNDTRAAAYGEHRFGAGRSSSSMAYLTVSTGISAGFVIDHQLLRSPNGLLGHVGFMTSMKGSNACGSGRFGTFESIASGRSIEARAQALGHRGLDSRQIFQKADEGVHWAADLVDDACAAVAELCANLSASLGIELVVLGGGVGLSEGYLNRVANHLNAEPERFKPKLVSAGLGKNSGLLGALATAMERSGAE